jgi:hypothetical protein
VIADKCRKKDEAAQQWAAFFSCKKYCIFAVLIINRDMEAQVTNPPLNSVQLFVLKTFATAKSEQERDELTSLYLDYIQRKMDEETDKWWKDNNMTQEKFEEMFMNLHHRTPYKQ